MVSENKPQKRSLWAKWPSCGRTWASPGRSLVSLEGNKRPPLDSELGNASEISARWKSWWGGCLQGLEQTDGQQLKRPQVLNDALARKSPRSPVTRTQCPGSPSGQRLRWIVWRMEGITYPSNHACPQKVNLSQHLPLCPWKGGQSKFLQLFIQLQLAQCFGRRWEWGQTLGELVRDIVDKIGLGSSVERGSQWKTQGWSSKATWPQVRRVSGEFCIW